MIKPLTLIPKHTDQSDILANEFSPSTRRRADSLVFSITSQKHYSPKDTILLQSRQEEVNKELESLQLKLCSLEDKVHYINTDPLLSQQKQTETQRKIKQESRFLIDYEQIERQINKQNYNRQNRAGKIVKKDKSLERSSKIVKMSRKNEKSKVGTGESRNSLGINPSSKQKQISQLKRAVNTMRQSMQRTQRSRSMCSQRLSASKSLIKTLKRQQKKNQKLISKLKAQLKKSETIRDKQKQVILRQQEEISHYRELLKLSKPIR